MRETIDRAIADGRTDALCQLLSGAGANDLRYAARCLIKSSPETVLERAKEWATHPDVTARRMACQLVPGISRDTEARAFSLLRKLVNDADWTVRDAAAEVCGRLLCREFPGVLSILHGWRSDEAANVRRAVVIAAARAVHRRHPERTEPLLKLIEPFLADRDALLRKNLGPYALGVTFLRHDPRITFEYLVRWSTSNDEQVLWNVAMAFSGPAAAPLVKKAIIVLRKLSLDPRRYVWRAVASALWKLGRRRPDIVRPELSRWLEDERRIPVAREALKHI